MGNKWAFPKNYKPKFLENLDARIGVVKQLKARLKRLTADLGGAENLSYQQMCLCERAIFLEHRIREWEASYVSGKASEDEFGKLTQATNALQGLFKTLGLERKARHLNLKDYIAGEDK